MEIKIIGIVGAGKMGHGIALSAALAGYIIILHDRTKEDLSKAINNIEDQLKKLINKDLVSAEAMDIIINNIQTTTTFEKFDTADLAIEAVPEYIDLKRNIFSKLDAICRKGAILVSNTSTFSITTLSEATGRPEHVAGMHFFLPPTKLVEITRGKHTSDETINELKRVAKKMDRIFVEVKKDSPGFIANRVYTPLLLEAIRAYEEGLASKEDIDLAMKSSYLPIGPFELADIIGLDVILSSLEYYFKKLGTDWTPPRSLKKLVKDGHFGKKNRKRMV